MKSFITGLLDVDDMNFMHIINPEDLKKEEPTDYELSSDEWTAYGDSIVPPDLLKEDLSEYDTLENELSGHGGGGGI